MGSCCVTEYIAAWIFPPLIVLSAPMCGLVSLVVWGDLLFLPSLYIKALLLFLFVLAHSSLRMLGIDLLSDLSWSALNSRLIGSCCIPNVPRKGVLDESKQKAALLVLQLTALIVESIFFFTPKEDDQTRHKWFQTGDISTSHGSHTAPVWERVWAFWIV